MDLQQILERFLLISGLSLEEASDFTPIIEEAQTEVESKIKENINISLNSRRLNAAAAALAFYKYALFSGSNNSVESFSAGDISIKCGKKPSADMARQVWNEAKASVSDILEDDEFLFQGMSFVE